MSKARDLANAGTALTTVDATELGYLDGVTSAVQTQIDGKQAVVSGVNDTEIGYLDGVTSAIQTQIDAKEPTLPSQTGNTGKYLTTDGTDKSWGTVSQYALPTQTGNSGKYLTTNGTNESWGTISAGGMTLLSTTSLSNQNSLTLSSISQDYKELYLTWRDVRLQDNNATMLQVRFNGISTNSFYYWYNVQYGYTPSASTANYIPVSGSVGTMNNTALHHGYVKFPFYSNSTNASRTYQGQSTWSRVTEGSGSSGTFFNGTCGTGSTFTTAITSLTLLTSNGNQILSGTVELYGVS
jgi:hypothetical protein